MVKNVTRDSHYMVTHINSIYYLTISNVTLHDTGVYSCLSNNELTDVTRITIIDSLCTKNKPIILTIMLYMLMLRRHLKLKMV